MFDLVEKFNADDPKSNFRLRKNEIIFSSLAINFLSLALPIMVLQVYDRIVLNHAIGTLWVLAIGVSVAVFLEFILRVARSYTTDWTGVVYEYILAANAIRLYLNADPTKLESQGAGIKLQNLITFQKLRDFFSGQALVTMVDIPFSILFLFIIFYLSGPLVMVPLLVAVLFAFLSWILGDKLKVALIEQDDADDKRYSFIIEALQGIHSIKSYGVESVFKRRYESFAEQSSLATYRASLIGIQGYNLGVFFSQVIVIMVVIFGAPMVINGDFTSGTLTAVILFSGRLMMPIQKALFLWNNYQDYEIAYEKAENIFSMPQIQREKSLKSLEVKGNISIKDISFQDHTKTRVLSGITLDLKAPDVVSIRGEDEFIKEKLLRILIGIEAPDSGSVEVDGVNVLSLTSEELVRHIGYMSSDNIVFQGSILENLCAFDENNEARAFEMAKLFNLDKEIALLPKGYNTQINDGFSDIVAPGVKQRIAVARALLHKPKVLLFDNADKGLDREGYNHLIRVMSMLKGKVAMILVTDDLNIKRLADREYLLTDNGLKEVKAQDSSIYDRKVLSSIYTRPV